VAHQRRTRAARQYGDPQAGAALHPRIEDDNDEAIDAWLKDDGLSAALLIRDDNL